MQAVEELLLMVTARWLSLRALELILINTRYLVVSLLLTAAGL